MAFRFRREGDRIKHRVHIERMGMQPWIEDFKWRVVDFHYNFYMGPKARSAIMSNQLETRRMQDAFDRQSHGCVRRAAPQAVVPAQKQNFPHVTKHFAWTTYIPQAVPYHKNSNPFCAVSHNKTGWREYVEMESRGAVRVKPPEDAQHRFKRIMDPKPKGWKHVVSGTDDTVPVFPTQ
eukprot:NODE_19531_length_839_cov_4.617978.p2 GENE.NODE_19531_length_839_cov_4.617978~~NODE_19531_length_839_cov_4.617978.p2  ORF type:complete len:178 (-),score=60.92 NODE_19531_length_839_cov_4.617978:223-756(-)